MSLVLAVFDPGIKSLVTAVMVASLVPVMTVAYRWVQADTPVDPVRAVLLYHLYFLARGMSLVDILRRRQRAGIG
jgi:hypothetical protein